MRIALLISIAVLLLACSDKKSEPQSAEAPATQAEKPEPEAAPPSKAIAEDEVAVNKAELRALCLLQHFPPAGGTGKMDVLSLVLDNDNPGEAFPWLIIDTEGTALGGVYTPQEFLQWIDMWSNYEPTSFEVCNNVGRYPRPTMVTAVVRDHSRDRKRGYWLYVAPTIGFGETGTVDPVFIGDVEHEDAQKKTLELLQEYSKKTFGSAMKFGGNVGPADWLEALEASS